MRLMRCRTHAAPALYRQIDVERCAVAADRGPSSVRVWDVLRQQPKGRDRTTAPSASRLAGRRNMTCFASQRQRRRIK